MAGQTQLGFEQQQINSLEGQAQRQLGGRKKGRNHLRKPRRGKGRK